MRKLIVLLMSVLVLSFGSAFAQQQPIVITEPETQDAYWATIAIGFPVGVAFGFGVSDLINNNIDVRFLAGIGTGGGFGVAADALFDLPFDLNQGAATAGPFDIYAGAGTALVLGGADFRFGIRVFGGIEYALTDIDFPSGAIFAELGPTLTLLPGFGGGLNARVGFNYYF